METEIIAKLSGKGSLSFLFSQDGEETSYKLVCSIKAPPEVTRRLAALLQSKLPVELRFYSPQLHLIPPEGSHDA
jgi:hypothetical protein